MAGKIRKKGGRGILSRTSDPLTGQPGGGGTGPAPAEKPGGGAPDPAGGGQPGGGGGTPDPSPQGIPVDVLPESLRGLPADRIKFTLDTLVKSVTATNERNKRLEEENRTLKTTPQPRKDTPPSDDGKPRKALADRLLEEPEAALDEYFSRRAGAYSDKIDELNRRLGDTEVDIVRRTVPDFDDVQDDVFDILDKSGTPRTKEALMGAYTMILGQQALEQRMLDQRKALGGSERPAPDSQPDPTPKYSKTSLTEEIRVGLGLSEEEYYDKHANANSFNVKVPT
jgi:hypothetical protein